MNTILVTAFFDIGRGKSGVPGMDRSNEKYFEYFKFWARMHNQLIIYTQPDFVDEVRRIRASFDLEDKTIIIPIYDITKIEPEIYSRMQNVENKSEYSNLRMHVKAMSNSAKYNYVTFMKFWFMKDASKRVNVSNGQIAWMDFGFNHGGECFTDPLDFDFEWKPHFESGIQIYALNNPNDRNAMGMLLLQSDCFMNCFMICSSDFCEILWNHAKEAVEALLMLDAMDDDQQILLMVYKKYPKDFYIYYCNNWFLPLKDFGGGHLKVKNNYGAVKKNSLFIPWIKRLLKKWIYKLRGKNILPTPYFFGKRMEIYAKKMNERDRL